MAKLSINQKADTKATAQGSNNKKKTGILPPTWEGLVVAFPLVVLSYRFLFDYGWAAAIAKAIVILALVILLDQAIVWFRNRKEN